MLYFQSFYVKERSLNLMIILIKNESAHKAERNDLLPAFLGCISQEVHSNQ